MCMIKKWLDKKRRKKEREKQEDVPSKEESRRQTRESKRGVRRVSDYGLNLIKRFEGLRLQSYKDVAGIWTIGYGHTGPDVKPNQTITESRATELLRHDVSKFEEGVRSAVKSPISQSQFDAMVSLAYNIGLAAFKRSSVLKHFNNGQHGDAADAFLMWNKATIDGKLKEVKGLTRRRKAERKLFLEGTNEESA